MPVRATGVLGAEPGRRFSMSASKLLEREVIVRDPVEAGVGPLSDNRGTFGQDPPTSRRFFSPPLSGVN